MIHKESKHKNDEKPKNEVSRIKRDVWFYLLIIILIAIAMIVIMALTGPKIGNIFSNISGPLLRGTP